MKAYYSRPPVWTALFVVAASSFVAECDARTWIDVVNPSVLMTSNLDVYRIEFFLEEDPLAFPSSAPTSEPTGSSDPEGIMFDDGVASSSPSASPTARYDNVKGYGGCPMGEYLYELEMLDSWGDGWDDSVIKITQMAMEEAGEGAVLTSAVNIFEGGLAAGREGYSYLCLEAFKCYTVGIDGSDWGEEIKWEIRAVPLGYSRKERENMGGLSVAKGLAPTSCQFSIPDEVTGEMECPFICDNESATSSEDESASSSVAPASALPTASPSSSAPSPASASLSAPSTGPSFVSAVATASPSSSAPSPAPASFFAPSTGPAFVSAVATTSPSTSAPSRVGSMMPSDAPSFVPSSIPTAITATSLNTFPASDTPSAATSLKEFRNTFTASDSPSARLSTPPIARSFAWPIPQDANLSSHPSAHPSAHPSDHPTAIPASEIPTTTFATATEFTGATEFTAVKEFRAVFPASDSPSTRPSASPSARPSNLPIDHPTDHPSNTASTFPSTSPSAPPSARPSTLHSAHPSTYPNPTANPTAPHPTSHPTIHPTDSPTHRPTNQPVSNASGRSIVRPQRPTWHPSQLPSDQPSLVPSLNPTGVP